MPVPRYRPEFSYNADVQNVSRAVNDVLEPLQLIPLIQGELLTDITITSGTPLEVSHQLGRRIQGWAVVRQNAQADIWDTPGSASAEKTRITLNASATVTVSLWVF